MPIAGLTWSLRKCSQGGRGTDDMASSVLPVRTRGGVVALESSFQGGIRREVLRSLCQLVNDTQLRLEVALVDDLSRRGSGASSRGFGRQESMVQAHPTALCQCMPEDVPETLDAPSSHDAVVEPSSLFS